MTGSEHLPQPPSGAPEQWGWARPVPATQFVETEPLEYHRLLRGVANYRWWKPLLLLLVAGVYFGVFTVILGIAFVPIFMMGDPDYFAQLATGDVEILDTQRPLSVLMGMTSIIVMLPSVVLAMLTLGMRPVGRIWSVATRIRWGLLGRFAGVAVLVLAVMTVTGVLADMAILSITDPAALTEPAADSPAEYSVSAALVSLVLVVLLVPLQAATEEVVFRGLFMQVLGAWVRNPWVAILVPSVAFAMAHIYDFWGLAAVGLLGGVAAWLTWRTGGLEAAIAIHIVNNLVGFGFMIIGLGGETAQTVEGGSAGSLIGQVLGLSLFIWLTLKIFGKSGAGRERIDLVEVPVAATPPGAGAEAPAPAPDAAPADAAPVDAPAADSEHRNG